jgi:hypothetical protein
MSGRDQRQQDLEDEDVGQREEAHGAAVGDGAAMFEDGLQDAEGPAEALAGEAVGVDGGLGEGERLVFVDDGVALLEQVHGEVGVFGDGVGVVAAAGLDGAVRQAPMAPGTTMTTSKRSRARRSKFWLVMYSRACQRVQRLTRLPTLALPATAPMWGWRSGRRGW